MEESEYKSAYSEIARVRCEFEKALTNNKARCARSRHFWLADREGYACESSQSSQKCGELLGYLREYSRFVLKLQQTGEKLPHNMEIRVQAGGLNGIQSLFTAEPREPVDDIHDLIGRVESEYGGLERLPYSRIVPSIGSYQGRKSKKRSSES